MSDQVITVQSEATAISRDMRELYNSFKDGSTTREVADTLANISGKNLKAIAIMMADQMRVDALRKVSALPADHPRAIASHAETNAGGVA